MGSACSYTEFINVLDVPRGLNDLQKRVYFSEEERPLAFQLYGSQVSEFISATRGLLPQQPDFLDINLGCSVRRVAGRGAGAGLLNQPEKVAEICRSLVKSVPVPVTAKIRLGWDETQLNYLELACLLQENGAAALAVHGRSRRDGWNVPSDWNAIRKVKQALSIPVIGNGDVRTLADIERMLCETGCDAVMVGRAALGNPWLFANIERDSLPLSKIITVIKDHWESMCAFYGEEKAAFQFRKHLKAYLACPQLMHLDARAIITAPHPFQALLACAPRD